MIMVIQEPLVARKNFLTDEHYSLHDQLEDGTLPFHDFITLGHAIDVHQELFGSMQSISDHTQYLIKQLYDGLSGLAHPNGTPLCRVYKGAAAIFGDPKTQGATIAFNVQRDDESIISYSEVERLANDNGIYLRSGGLCNPGEIASHLHLAPWEFKRAYSAGHRCGHATQIISGKPTGVVRSSLGAMSTLGDVNTFLMFMKQQYLPHPHAMSAEEVTAVPKEMERVMAVDPNTRKRRTSKGASESTAIVEDAGSSSSAVRKSQRRSSWSSTWFSRVRRRQSKGIQ